MRILSCLEKISSCGLQLRKSQELIFDQCILIYEANSWGSKCNQLGENFISQSLKRKNVVCCRFNSEAEFRRLESLRMKFLIVKALNLFFSPQHRHLLMGGNRKSNSYRNIFAAVIVFTICSSDSNIGFTGLLAPSTRPNPYC